LSPTAADVASLTAPLDLSSPSQVQGALGSLRQRQVELEEQNQELQQDHAALCAVRDRYLHLYEQAPVGYVALHSDGGITEANHRAAVMLGVPKAQTLGRHFCDFIAPEDCPRWQRALSQLAQGEDLQSIELRLQHPGRERRWAAVDLVLVGESKDAAREYRAALVDIHERVVLQEGRARLAAMVSSAGEAMISRDADGCVTSWNAAAERLFGVPAREMLGRTMEGLVPLEHRGEESDLLQRAARGEHLAYVDAERLGRDGALLQLSLSLAPLHDDDGRLLGSALVARDVGDRKLSERAQRQRLVQLDLLSRVGRDLILGRPDAAAEHDLFDRVRETVGADIYLNYRVDGPDETPVLTSSRSLAPESRPEFSDPALGIGLAERVVESQAPLVIECKYGGERADLEALDDIGVQCYAGFPLIVEGKVRAVAAFASTRRDLFEEGDVQVIQAVCAQLSAMMQRSHLLHELHAREQSLQQAGRAKDHFLAMVAHELRNPLAPIRNAVAILRRCSGLDPQMAWCGDIIERQVEQMARLMEDLLDASRLSRDRIELRCERIRLSDVVEQALEAARPLLAAHGHRLRLHLPERAIWLDADLTRLTQVFVNLLNNAAKYTDAGGRIGLAVSEERQTARISVRDNGIGIEADQLPKVFGMFAQLSPALERSHGGLGIGLSLARMLVELHGGRIEAHSAGLGQGSEFIVHLPTVLAGEEQTGAAADDPPALSRRRLLVVDDNIDAAQTLATILSLEGQDVRTAFGSLEALELAEQWRPEVALVDIGLPELNGYEVCRRIRAQPWGERMLLVACTGWGSPEDRERTRQAGFNFHLVKPIQLEAVLKLIAEQVVPETPSSA
jgi:PAS domain S-box-containing protein